MSSYFYSKHFNITRIFKIIKTNSDKGDKSLPTAALINTTDKQAPYQKKIRCYSLS